MDGWMDAASPLSRKALGRLSLTCSMFNDCWFGQKTDHKNTDLIDVSVLVYDPQSNHFLILSQSSESRSVLKHITGDDNGLKSYIHHEVNIPIWSFMHTEKSLGFSEWDMCSCELRLC